MSLTTIGAGLLGTQAQYTGFKNRIINGAMMIDQRNAVVSVTPTVDATYSIDRWMNRLGAASKFSIQRNAGAVTPPVGFTNYLGITSLSAFSITASDYFAQEQRIEGFNFSDFAWGTANAAPVTVSFWVRSSLTGTFGGALANSAQTRTYPFTYTVSAANTWERKSVTIAGDISGTWVTDSGVGVSLRLGFGVGSTYSGTAGAWSANNNFSATGATSVVGTNGATFYITGVQLEKGSTATSFDYRPYGTELALCQRYFELGSSALYGCQFAGFLFGLHSSYKQTKRTAPTISISATQGSPSAGSITTQDFQFSQTVGGSGGPYAIYIEATWTASSEL